MYLLFPWSPFPSGSPPATLDQPLRCGKRPRRGHKPFPPLISALCPSLPGKRRWPRPHGGDGLQAPPRAPTAASAGGRRSGRGLGRAEGGLKAAPGERGGTLKLRGGEAGAARSAASGGATLIGAAWPRCSRRGDRPSAAGAAEAGEGRGREGRGGAAPPGQLRPHLLRGRGCGSAGSSAGAARRGGSEGGREAAVWAAHPVPAGFTLSRQDLPWSAWALSAARPRLERLGECSNPASSFGWECSCLCRVSVWLTAKSSFTSQQLSVSALCEVRTASCDTKPNQGSCN